MANQVVLTVNQRDMAIQETSTIELKFDIDFNATTAQYDAYSLVNEFSEMIDMKVESHTYRQGQCRYLTFNETSSCVALAMRPSLY